MIDNTTNNGPYIPVFNCSRCNHLTLNNWLIEMHWRRYQKSVNWPGLRRSKFRQSHSFVNPDLCYQCSDIRIKNAKNLEYAKSFYRNCLLCGDPFFRFRKHEYTSTVLDVVCSNPRCKKRILRSVSFRNHKGIPAHKVAGFIESWFEFWDRKDVAMNYYLLGMMLVEAKNPSKLRLTDNKHLISENKLSNLIITQIEASRNNKPILVRVEKLALLIYLYLKSLFIDERQKHVY